MPGNVIAFNGFGSFRGQYSMDPLAGNADIVIVQLAAQASNRQTYVTNARVHVSNLTANPPGISGFFVDWAVIIGDANAALNSISGLTPKSGFPIGPGSYGQGYNFLTASINSIQGITTEIGGGRTFVPVISGSTQGAEPPQYVWNPPLYAPPNNSVQLIVYAPAAIVTSVTAAGALNFAFHVDVHGSIEGTGDAAPISGYRLTRAIPPRTA